MEKSYKAVSPYLPIKQTSAPIREIDLMRQISLAFEYMTVESRARVIEWANAHINSEEEENRNAK